MSRKNARIINFVRGFSNILFYTASCSQLNNTDCDRCTSALDNTVSRNVPRHSFTYLLRCSVFGAIRIRFAGSGGGVGVTYCQLAQTVVDITGITDHAQVRKL